VAILTCLCTEKNAMGRARFGGRSVIKSRERAVQIFQILLWRQGGGGVHSACIIQTKIRFCVSEKDFLLCLKRLSGEI
jgi:hypothetical protein